MDRLTDQICVEGGYPANGTLLVVRARSKCGRGSRWLSLPELYAFSKARHRRRSDEPGKFTTYLVTK